MNVGFVGVLSCLVLMLALFFSTGVASAHSVQATQSQVSASTSVNTAVDQHGPYRYGYRSGRYRYCTSYRYRSGRYRYCYRYGYHYGRYRYRYYYSPNGYNGYRYGRYRYCSSYLYGSCSAYNYRYGRYRYSYGSNGGNGYGGNGGNSYCGGSVRVCSNGRSGGNGGNRGRGY